MNKDEIWEMHCYGCLESEVDTNGFSRPSKDSLDRLMRAMQILSDAQHIMPDEESCETARKLINKSKWFISEVMEELANK